jgi:hypothetical protein
MFHYRFNMLRLNLSTFFQTGYLNALEITKRPYRRQFGSWPETGLWETSTSVSKALPDVNSLGPNSQLLIALHSPYALLETGL